jgi:SH3-like domain-containing protein
VTAPAAPPPPKPPPPVAEPAEPPPKIPRFAALKTDETNMRKGPGQRYPIEWVYQRHDLPVEVEREYDVWRYVRDPDGVEGWVHGVTLSDRRTFIVTSKDAVVRSDANDTAAAVAVLKVGVIGRLRECDGGSQWCQVQVGGYKGYLRRDQIWGLLPDEVLAPS